MTKQEEMIWRQVEWEKSYAAELDILTLLKERNERKGNMIEVLELTTQIELLKKQLKRKAKK